MNDAKPAKKQSLGSLGWILIMGGIIIVYRAGETEKMFDRLGEGGSVSWAVPLGALMIIVGAGCFIAGLVKR
jgi:hypothetical protein